MHQRQLSFKHHQGQLKDKLLNDHLSIKEMEKIVKKAEKTKQEMDMKTYNYECNQQKLMNQLQSK